MKESIKRVGLKNCLIAGMISACIFSTAAADDTEVFFGQVDPSLDIFPNVLFVLDTSGSMNAFDGGSESRLERMKLALDTILDNSANVNVGMMRFNGSSGGGAVLFPVTPIDEEICAEGNCGDITLSPRISSSTHDAEEHLDDNSVSLDGDILTMGVTTGARDQAVGLHFNDLNIPQGATITTAKLEFTSHNTTSQDTDLTIYGELIEDADPFANVNSNVSTRARTAGVNWKPGDWDQGLIYQTSDISSVVQEIVDQNDWCGGNSLGFVIEGTGSRSAKSYDQSASSAPALKITYDTTTIPTGGGCTTKTATVQISAGSDDAEEQVSNTRVNNRSSDLELPRDGSREQIIGMRFTELSVPQGAEILSASIEFEVDRYRSGFVSLQLSGEATDNAGTYRSKKRNISARSKTSAKVNWIDVDSPGQNAKISTPDLSPIVQEIVDRGGWDSGNAMAFMITKLSGSYMREFEAYNGEPAAAPKLRVEYKVDVGSASEPTYITARDRLKEVVNGLTATGGTPIVDAYYEAASYFRGDEVDYGKQRGFWGHRFHRVSHPDSYDPGSSTVYRDPDCTDNDLDHPDCRYEKINGTANYISPLKSACQTNHIVFLSDGAATSNSAKSKVQSLTGVSNCRINSGSQACGEELAHWLNNTDHSPGITGKQNITTYTIGFNFSGDFLPELAQKGGGNYHTAESAQDLVEVFQSILGDVLSVDTSFVAPGATVNQFNRLTHRDDIYFALFKPDQRPTWTGNLKRYRVGTDADTGEVTILDATLPDGKPAVDVDSGFFKEDSRSWWRDTSAENDGNQVGLGGAAEQLDFNGYNRRIFTYIGDNASIPGTGFNLAATANAISETNADLDFNRLGLEALTGTAAENTTYRSNLLKWARGVDINDEDDDDDHSDWRQRMGDPMHARPVIVNYSNGDALPLTTIFVGTNEGYLHAIEREEGKEVFSYIPQELLPNLRVFFDNQSSNKHPYGLDGSLSVWHDDANSNVTIDNSEEAFLYTGMRRGGRNYYALNIANRTNPKLAWVIEGGQPGFEELGQTWSKATPARIEVGGTERDVLIFGGGYDTNQDPDPNGVLVTRTPDSVGRGIFIVDARTGALIWSALGAAGGSQHFPDMKYSIPSDLRILDSDFNGLADQIFVGDTGGQIWRFDIKPNHTSGDLLSGGVLASLGGSEYADQRRFYYEPDVALISDNGQRFYSISIGSGWRAHPLDIQTNDQFFMIKDTTIVGAPDGYGKFEGGVYAPITETDLNDITTNLSLGASDYGWRLNMTDTGEKILGDSITVNNQIIFTSYQPALAVGACTTAIGGGSVYTVSVLDGSPTLDMDEDDDLDVEDRKKSLAHGGIPPEPAALITEDGPTILVGPEQPIKPNFDNLTQRTFWIDNGNDFAENDE